MTIIIPMAGASSRFIKEGYKPKYMLELKPGYTMFQAALESFKDFFKDAMFVFVTNSPDTTLWVEHELSTKMQLSTYKIVTLDSMTQGQAETVYYGLTEAYSDIFIYELDMYKNNSRFAAKYKYENLVVIFNIDTIRHNFKTDLDNWYKILAKDSMHQRICSSDFALFDAVYDETADPSKWSFCDADPYEEDKLLEIRCTAEKKKVGNWYSTGLYIFKNMSSYIATYKNAITHYSQLTKDNNPYNYYIAPLYNVFANVCTNTSNRNINYVLPCKREDVEFAGVPADYEALKKKYNS